ncbi:haloacid dehalogenase type II [Nocardia sp. NPDC051570]|uniref:haloacid dehalogenase type II n=1 Tax=Nocardia sp. NPDC051570 TaxID=3364324 RepID=UPI00378CA5AA
MIDRPGALLFDVQGTATDFHTTVTRESRRILGPRYPDLDWSRFVNDWRTAYFESTRAVGGAGEWVSVAALYRTALDELLTRRGLELDEAGRRDLTDAWKRLDPWPDARAGLIRLRTAYTLATLSNADVNAVVAISRHCDFPWHAVFAAEMARAFKPDPRTYALAARYLDLPPGAIMMVASHKYDLRAAQAEGMRTAFIARPAEYGDPALADIRFEAEFDINATDFEDLATRLGC